MMFRNTGRTNLTTDKIWRAALAQAASRFLAVAVAASLMSVALMNRAQAQVNANGLDPTFDDDGIATTNFFNNSNSYGSGDSAYDVVIQPDGKIVVVGSTGSYPAGEDFAVARYNRGGHLDKTFDVDGKQTINFRMGAAEAVALQPDGKIVVAGYQHTSLEDFYAGLDFALARLNRDGSLDQTFGRSGRLTTDFFHNYDRAFDVAVQSDGKIVVAGEVGDGLRSYFGLARYNRDGSLDDGSARDATPSDSFGNHGKLTADMVGGAILIQPDGKIVVAGGGETGFVLARYHSDGSPDTTFGSGGRQTTDFPDNYYSLIRDIALQPDGKIVAAGNLFLTDGIDFALARYNTDGSLDTSFDSDGRQTTSFSHDAQVAGVAILPDGKIVVAGNTPHRFRAIVLCCIPRADFALARYNQDGQLDLTLDDDGMLITDLFCSRFDLYPYVTGSIDTAQAIAAQPDGKVIVVGEVFRSTLSSTDFAVVRYPLDAITSMPPLISLNLSDPAVLGGKALTGKVKVCTPARKDTVITLASNLAATDVPASVMIPAGESMATFAIKTTAVTDFETGTITASLGTTTKSMPLRVRPIGVLSLTLSPNPAQGPQSVTGVVTLELPAPAGGITVTLASNNPEVAHPTASQLFFPPGLSRRSFTVRANDVPSSRSTLIKATANGSTKGQVLTVQ